MLRRKHHKVDGSMRVAVPKRRVGAAMVLGRRGDRLLLLLLLLILLMQGRRTGTKGCTICSTRYQHK